MNDKPDVVIDSLPIEPRHEEFLRATMEAAERCHLNFDEFSALTGRAMGYFMANATMKSPPGTMPHIDQMSMGAATNFKQNCGVTYVEAIVELEAARKPVN